MSLIAAISQQRKKGVICEADKGRLGHENKRNRQHAQSDRCRRDRIERLACRRAPMGNCTHEHSGDVVSVDVMNRFQSEIRQCERLAPGDRGKHIRVEMSGWIERRPTWSNNMAGRTTVAGKPLRRASLSK
jgi:hypothetical protein